LNYKNRIAEKNMQKVLKALAPWVICIKISLWYG